MSEIYAVTVIVTGRVQGVFFRASTQDAANSRQVNGWIKNMTDGSVQALFQGTKSDVNGMVEWCWQGPPQSRAESVATKAVAVDPALTRFTILY